MSEITQEATESRTQFMRRLYDEGGYTLREIGGMFNITGERVRQILSGDGYVPRKKLPSPPKTKTFRVVVERIAIKVVDVEATKRSEAKTKAILETKFDDGLPQTTMFQTRVVGVVDDEASS